MDDILDGGSAAPATPDVPTTVHPALACPSIIDPDSYWVPGGCACVLTRGRNPDAPTVVDDSECPIHSGVAGEPKATTKGSCCPEFARNGYSHTEICPAFEDNDPARPAQIAVDVSGTQGHSPTPSNPSVELSTGCVVVPDEAVEATARADELAIQATKIARSVGDRCFRDWHGMANRDAYVGQVIIRAALEAVQEALTGVIPGIVEVAVEEAEKDLRPLIAAQALRQAARDFNHPMCSKCANELDERADELERGAIQPLEWYAPHDHGDGVGSHQHFPANGGHGSHEGVQLVAYRPEREAIQPEPTAEVGDDEPTQDDLNALVELLSGRVDQAQRMGAVLLAGTLLDAGYRRVGGDHVD